jgi:hypothetical protein
MITCALVRTSSILLFLSSAVLRSQDTPETIVRVPPEAAQAAIRKEFGSNFRVMETDHFKVISDTSVRYHRLSAAVMERVQAEMRSKYLKADFKPVTVYLIERGVDFERFVTKRGHENLREAFGSYVPKERAMYTHRLRTNGNETGIGTLHTLIADPALEADFPKDAPAWFIGSFGALFEQSRIRKGKLVYGNPAPLRGATLRSAFEGGGMPTLAKFFQIPNATFYDAAGVNLATGRTIMCFLLRLGEDKLAKFVTAIRQKKSGAAAIESATGMKLVELEKKWREHVANHEIGADWIARAAADAPNRDKIMTEAAPKFLKYGDVQKAYAHALMRQNKNEEAAARAQAALDDPSFFAPDQAWSIIGSCFWNSDPKKALDAYANALSHQPWMEEVVAGDYRNYSTLLKEAGRADEAEKVLTELERLTAESAIPGGK